MTASTAEQVARICADLLGLERVDVRDDLYELGCDSQQAVRIALRIERVFLVELPLEVMETSGRVDGIADWIDRQVEARDALVAASNDLSADAP